MYYLLNFRHCFILINYVMLANSLEAEIKIGSIEPIDMKTYENNISGFTEKEYSIITWKYIIKRYNYTGDSPDLFLYFRHFGQLEFNSERDCVSFKGGYSISTYDPRWLHLSDGEDTYRDKRCSLSGTTLTCEGELKIAIGFDTKFYVAAIYECKCTERPFLNLWYNLTVVPHDEVTCRNLSTDLVDVTPVLAREQLEECLDFYPMYSPWNPQGYTIPQVALSYATFLRFLQVSLECYKHAVELICRIRLPQCVDNKVLIPCQDMCDDVNIGCADVFETLGFKMSCNSHSSMVDNNNCTYIPVMCPADPIPPSNGYIVGKFNRTAGSHAHFKCQNGCELHGDHYTVCAYSGEWTTIGTPECRNITKSDSSIDRAFAVSFSMVVIALVLVALMLFYFRFEFKILIFRYCSYCFCLLKTSAEKKKYHAFIACDEDRDLEKLIQKKLHHPLERMGYKLFAEYSDFIVNVPPVRYIPEAISESHRVIVILNQEFLDSNWCQYTLEQSFLQQIESEILRVVIVLMQDKKSLKDVPRFLQSFLRTKYYIHIDDPLFLTKLRYELPNPNNSDIMKPGEISNGFHVY